MFGLSLILLSLISIQHQILTHESPSPMTLQLILEYSKWRSWNQIVLFDDLSASYDALSYIKPLLRCLSDQGMSISFQPIRSPKLPEVLRIQTHRVGAIVLLDHVNSTSADNVLKIASNKRLFDYYISWLLITSRPNDASIDISLRNLSIGINTDVIIATSSRLNQYTQTRDFWNKTCKALRDYTTTYEYIDTNNEENIIENVTQNLDYSPKINSTVCFYLVHIYKIKISDNFSLIVDPLGSWSPGMLMIKLPMDVVLRNNFHRLPIIVGVLNGTSESQDEENSSYEDGNSDDSPLNDFINFLASSLNASLETVFHEKVGTMTNKVWSNLLGDIYSGNVDIGLGYITINDDRQRDMTFSHPLIRYTRNIYIRPPESSSMRDIFLQPFNNRLLLCVALMHTLIVLTIGTINYATKNSSYKQSMKGTSFGEATLWCTGIMFMQGSPWKPQTLSGKLALLSSLIFALVTYNAYAGFITSILSVQVTGIKNVNDLLQNNFKVGYSELDDEFMRTTNDSNLRLLYIKAFNSRESRLDTTLGLKKAVDGGYGFFASASLARRTLRTALIQERCSLKEIEVGQTFTTVALPMEKQSPYEKIINLSILKMREHGVIDRIADRMLPDMPKCRDSTTFRSARIADVYSAFIILMIGVVTAISLGIVERIWNNRLNLKNKLFNYNSNDKSKNNQILSFKNFFKYKKPNNNLSNIIQNSYFNENQNWWDNYYYYSWNQNIKKKLNHQHPKLLKKHSINSQEHVLPFRN
ncbi:uncharacterized protein [Chelonus insularis]|uniref:uncharacterized protein isoform X2 n=1 Tax=Chelonus insularis TaxID=460826 RepID=UPI00158D2011|nr:uncharacterized protein LOC118069990 isoform X2 [Chelonus insularis]